MHTPKLAVLAYCLVGFILVVAFASLSKVLMTAKAQVTTPVESSK
jgi:hypothetical protein